MQMMMKMMMTMMLMTGWFLPLICLLVSGTTRTQNDTLGCRKDLGMYSGEIPDSAISSSSSYDEKSVGPLNARIRTEKNGGAWCPKKQITRDVYEWLQIDLQHLHFISQVETQGRFGNGQGQEFATNYLLEYQRFSGDQWIRYKDRKGVEVREGNSNTYLAELRDLHPPIIAQSIRFVPYSNHPRTVCMRVEVYGCPWSDGVTSYEMQQGDRRGGGELDFSDFTYDGHQNATGYLMGGLGQLTDGDTGNVQFRLDLQSIGKRGFEWLAWKREEKSEDYVEIIFRFDQVRNFSEVRIHANNMFSKDIGVFKLARFYFSVGGHYYNGEVVEYEHPRNVQVEEAKYITIPIPHRAGRHVKVQLYYEARWIMISEIRFNSDSAADRVILKVKSHLTSSPSSRDDFRDKPEIVSEVLPDETEPVLISSTPSPNIQTIRLDNIKTTGAQKLMTSQSWSSSKQKELTVVAADDVIVKGPATDTPSMARPEKDSLVGILLGTFAALFVLSTIIAFLLLIRYRRKKFNSPLKSMFIDDHVNFNLNHFSHTGKILNGNMYNSIASNDYMDTNKDTPLCNTANLLQPDLQQDTEGLYSTLPGNYNFDNYNGSAHDENISPRVSAFPQNSGWTDPNFNQFQGAGLPPCPSNNPTYPHSGPLFNFSPDKLRFVVKLGDGTFGEVHICEATVLPISLEQSFRLSQCCQQTNRGAVLTAVRMLRDKASDKERRDFENEIELLSCLSDPNLVQTLGICKTDKLYAIVSEYTALGNLREFLSQRILESNTSNRRTSQYPLSHGCLIYFATQIASGMKYLESGNLVHKDLACRNCLIGHRFVVKISDFGSSRRLYPGDYHVTSDDVIMPLRWMSWEAALLKQFSCKSDVWAFGVTLWEIMTFARIRPFSEMSNEQVIENFGHYYRSDSKERHLAAPVGCSKEIYDLMMECWRKEETRRPAFHEIHMFLSRKNIGYSPLLEQPNCCSAARDYRVNV